MGELHWCNSDEGKLRARKVARQRELDAGSLTVRVLRELFRNLEVWRAGYSDGLIEETVEGVDLGLLDLEYIYEQLPECLSTRQWQAIEYFLVQGYTEEQVAEMMGTSSNNPVGSYATAGLKNIIRMIKKGEFDRFRLDPSFYGEAGSGNSS